MQSGAEIDQINIEKDKSGVVGQIPELRRGSLVAALSQLSLREGHCGQQAKGGGRVRSTIDNIRLSTPISSQVKRSEQRKKQRFIPVCCWCKLFLELLTYAGIRRS